MTDRIEVLEKALREFLNAMHAHGEYDDGCFYYNGRSASELEKAIELGDAALAVTSADRERGE